MLSNKNVTDHLAAKYQTYLREALNLNPIVRVWVGEKNLPLFLRENYGFYQTRIANTEALLMIAKKGEEKTPATLAKHMAKVSEKWTHDLLFVDEAVSSLNRKRLVEQGISFVIPGNQMYLPLLGVDFREHFRKIHTPRSVFSPATQVLLLDAIYHPKGDPISPKVSAIRLGYTSMTMTRVFNELEQAGVGEHSVHGRERLVRIHDNGRQVWESVAPFLKSPVKRKFHVVGPVKKGIGTIAGLSALSEYSNLAESEPDVLAIESHGMSVIEKSHIQMTTSAPGPTDTEIQLWYYSPARFARNGIADPLSVYLSLKDSEDERVQSGLKNLLKGMEW